MVPAPINVIGCPSHSPQDVNLVIDAFPAIPGAEPCDIVTDTTSPPA
jgi:hypothetical protein